MRSDPVKEPTGDAGHLRGLLTGAINRYILTKHKETPLLIKSNRGTGPLKLQQPPERAGAKSSGEIRQIRKHVKPLLGTMTPSDNPEGVFQFQEVLMDHTPFRTRFPFLSLNRPAIDIVEVIRPPPDSTICQRDQSDIYTPCSGTNA